MKREPALDPFEERLAVDRIGTAFILRSLTEGPIVLTADDLDRLQRSLGTDPEIPDPAKTLRCHLKADIGEVAETDACGSRRPTRAQKRNARPRRAEQNGETSMRVSRLPSGPPKVPEAQLRTIVKRHLNQPEMRGYVRGLAHLGIDAAKIEEGAMKKLSHLTKPVPTKAKPSAAVRIHDLKEKLAKERNPIVRAELTRRIEFAKLERGSK